ncbi:MAG: YcgN family cysteine cluster protein [Pseudomonadota bacterium]
MPDAPFWTRKTLAEMTPEEWESLCDGCGRCCLVKLEDEDSGDLHFTDVACGLLECDACRCTDYDNRHERMPDCVALTPERISELKWMPPTCAYRLVAEGRSLYWWHHLVSGDSDTVHQAGISVRGRVVSEDGLDLADLIDRIADWPNEDDSTVSHDKKVI